MSPFPHTANSNMISSSSRSNWCSRSLSGKSTLTPMRMEESCHQWIADRTARERVRSWFPFASSFYALKPQVEAGKQTRGTCVIRRLSRATASCLSYSPGSCFRKQLKSGRTSGTLNKSLNKSMYLMIDLFYFILLHCSRTLLLLNLTSPLFTPTTTVSAEAHIDPSLCFLHIADSWG